MAGSIRNRGGISWELTVTCGRHTDGTKRRFYKTVKCSERQAKKELALFVAQVEQKQLLNLENITLSGFVERWLRDYAEPHLTPRGLLRYKQLLSRTLYALGHLKLTQITPLHITEFYNNLRETGVRKDGKPGGLSEYTIKHHHALINKILNDAVSWGLLIANPVARVKAPKAEKKEAKSYDEKQILQLLLALEEEEIQFQIMVKMALVTGCRRGELVALRWNDINFDTNEIKIERAATYTPEYGQQVKATKTEKSRKMMLPVSFGSLLKEYKNHQSEKQTQAGYKESEYLFTKKNGDMLYIDTPTKQFTRFIKKWGFPHITLHGLRHTHGTALLISGIDLRTVSNRLGHSEASTTLNVYTHAQESADKAAADVMDQILVNGKRLRYKVEG